MEEELENPTPAPTKVMQALILFVIIVLLMFVVLSKITEKSRITYEEETCRESTRMHSLSQLKGPKLASDIDCPTKTVEIKKDGIYADDKKIEDFGKKDIDEAIKKAMADRMALCWSEFGKGTLELFDTKRGKKEKFCVICDYVKFEEKNKKPDHFFNFLATNNVQKKYGNMKYSEYLTGYTTTQEIIDASTLATDDNINTQDNYAVVFAYAKKTGFWDKFMGAGVLGGAGLVSGLVGAGLLGLPIAATGAVLATVGAGTGFGVGGDLNIDWDSGVLLVPYDQAYLSQLDCEYMPARQE